MHQTVSNTNYKIPKGAVRHLVELSYDAEAGNGLEPHETSAYNRNVRSGCEHCRKAAAECLK